MSAVDAAGLMILRAKAAEAESKANQAEVYAVYAAGTIQTEPEISTVAAILERTMTSAIVNEARYERERASLFQQAVQEAEDAKR